jgi:cold shock CspA family protein
MDGMRYKSTIRFWNREKGFGFCSYIDGQGREISLFAHCTQFKSDKRIPKAGNVIEFQIGADKASRPMAVDITFVETDDTGRQTDEQLQRQ